MNRPTRSEALACSRLREGLEEVLAAIDDRDTATPRGSTPPAVSPAQLVRIAVSIRSGGRRLVSLPTAAQAEGVDVEALRRAAACGHIQHARELGLVFVDTEALPSPTAIPSLAAAEGRPGRYRARRLPRRVRIDSTPMLRLAAQLLLERAATRSPAADVVQPDRH